MNKICPTEHRQAHTAESLSTSQHSLLEDGGGIVPVRGESSVGRREHTGCQQLSQEHDLGEVMTHTRLCSAALWGSLKPPGNPEELVNLEAAAEATSPES